jgi:glycosyltransferase involved in cell wall biosynthesis
MVVVAQLGARMHYAVPSILARSGMLERLYTDIYAPSLPKALQNLSSRFGPTPLRRWLARIPKNIPEEKIVSFTTMGLEYYRRRRLASTQGSMTATHLWAGKEFCRHVIKRGLGRANSVYTYNSAGLELLEYARKTGKSAVMEQTIASGFIEDKLLEEEQSVHAQWSPSCFGDPFRSAFKQREQMEWEAADVILCGSEFVRDSIKAGGGPIERCRIVPYGVSVSSSAETEKCKSHRPLRVFTAGAVGLRKGTPYLLAAARVLKGKAEFRMAGALNVTPYAENLLHRDLALLGAVPRSDIREQFAWADVFLLPTLCEGSATVCYEALSYGLPVITTPNAGSVIRDGVDGFIVPIRDSAAIADRIERLADDGDLWAAMSSSARERASEYTVEKYGERLLSTLREAAPDSLENNLEVRPVLG